jgi:membrane protein DedA with SNARE-associated domain
VPLTDAPPDLPGFLGDIAPVLDHWGYLAVGGLLFLEDFGIPVPGETILIASAVYAGAGRLNMISVVVIAVVAAVLGDNVGYLIGRYGGHRLIDRYGKYVLLPPERVRKAEDFFMRHGGKIVTVARFVDGLRQANGIIAGMTLMPWPRFLLFNTLGALLWVGAWSTVGFFAGQHLDTLYPQIQRYELILAALVVAGIVLMIVRHLRRRRRGRQAAAAGAREHDDGAGNDGGARNGDGAGNDDGPQERSNARDPSDGPNAHAPDDDPDSGHPRDGGEAGHPRDGQEADGPHDGGDPDDPGGARDIGGRRG